MRESIPVVLGVGYVLVSISLIIIAATRKYLPGRVWFIAFLAIGLANALSWQIPLLLIKANIDFDIRQFYGVFRSLAGFINLAGFCMLIPFLFAIKEAPLRTPIEGVAGAVAAGHGDGATTGDTSNPLYGVAGWLKFFVIVQMFIAPVVFGLQQVIGFAAISQVAHRYPGLLVIGLIEAAIGLFFVVKWILIARRVRDRVSGMVQEVKKWLLITLGLNLISIPLLFLSGVDAEDLAPQAIKSFATSVISFTIWYSYFSVSKRVKATFPDWDR